jgi:uncharacterized protein (DUF4415 family)
MTENKETTKNNFKSDFAKIDAYVLTQADYDEIPELTEDFFIHADLYHGEKLIRRGRPRKETPKIHLGIRLDADIVHALKARGKGWQTLANQALREWVEKHP